MQLRDGRAGLSLLQDTQLIETLAHFSRERIPERHVHGVLQCYVAEAGTNLEQ